MPDNEYIYIQLTARADNANARFTVQAVNPKVLPPPPTFTPPAIPGTPPPPGTTVLTPPNGLPNVIIAAAKKTNLALIIGIVAGVLGFVAIIGFLVYYVMRQKRLQEERLAEEEDEDEDAVQEFRSAKRKPNSRKRRIQ